jgi:hypothetical protein
VFSRALRGYEDSRLPGQSQAGAPGRYLPPGSRDHDDPVVDSTTGDSLSFDTSVAHPARIYNYWLGGKDNYEADRQAAEQAIAVTSDILPGVRANRAFLRRAVEFVAGQGIRQFLDVGTGCPRPITPTRSLRTSPPSRGSSMSITTRSC